MFANFSWTVQSKQNLFSMLSAALLVQEVKVKVSLGICRVRRMDRSLSM